MVNTSCHIREKGMYCLTCIWDYWITRWCLWVKIRMKLFYKESNDTSIILIELFTHNYENIYFILWYKS